MRPLTLHASALNDEEYALYTSSITDLALCDTETPTRAQAKDDTFYEGISVSVREVRAWLRGRYEDVALSSIDSILKLFSSSLAQGDTLSGGQFFAALRLVVHVQNGKEVDRALAFVQARPLSSGAGPSSVRKSASEDTASVPPQLPRRSVDASSLSEPPPPVNPRQAHSPNNPFVKKKSKSTSSRSEDGSARIPPLPPRKPASISANTNTPVVPPPRHASIPVSSPVPARSQASASSTSTSTSLPRTHSPTHHVAPPIPPPLKPRPTAHITSPLIQQSLMASKTAKTMKKAEEQLEKERVLQVLRSSATSSPFSSSDDRPPPALPKRQRPQHSPPGSASSLEQVALAAPPPPPMHPDRKPPPPPPPPQMQSPFRSNLESFEAIYGTSPFGSPSRTSPPSPTKPFYSFSVDASTPTTPYASTSDPFMTVQQGQSRVQRSRSLHVPGAKGPPPVPPPKPPTHVGRRKRPESIQVFSPSSNGESLFGNGGGPATVSTSTFTEAKNSIFSNQGGHRRSSYSSSYGGSGSASASATTSTFSSTPFGSDTMIQRKLAELQLNAIPVLEKARYKAEAGLSPRRGFIPNGSGSGVSSGVGGRRSTSMGRGEDREGLLMSYDDGYEDGLGQDESGDEMIGDGKERRNGSGVNVERDELKWPPGEGWNRML